MHDNILFSLQEKRKTNTQSVCASLGLLCNWDLCWIDWLLEKISHVVSRTQKHTHKWKLESCQCRYIYSFFVMGTLIYWYFSFIILRFLVCWSVYYISLCYLLLYFNNFFIKMLITRFFWSEFLHKLRSIPRETEGWVMHANP